MAYLERVFETMDEKPTVADLPSLSEYSGYRKVEFM